MIKQEENVIISQNLQPFMQAFIKHASEKDHSNNVVIAVSMESIGDFEPHILFETSTGEQTATLDRVEKELSPCVVVYRNKMNREANHGLQDTDLHFKEYDWGSIHLFLRMFQPVTKQDQRAIDHAAKVLYDFLVTGMNSEILGTIFNQLMSNPDYLALHNEDQRRRNIKAGRPENDGLWCFGDNGKPGPISY